MLRYLKGTNGLRISFIKTGKLDLILYIDAHYAGSLIDSRSTTGYCTMLGGKLVTWRSKKQNVMSKSSTEAEFCTMSSGIDEVIWIRGILQELRISYEEPIRVLCDNRSPIHNAHDHVYHDQIIHVNIHRFYIKEKLDEKILETSHVNSTGQCVDIFTNGLPIKTFSKLISKLGMKNIHSCA